jgi:hypothetical protein
MSQEPVRPNIYILHSEDAPDISLARTIKGDLSELEANLVPITADELVLRYQDSMRIPEVGQAARILQGTVIAILSETMLSDASRRIALVAAVGGRSFIDFRRYFICRGTTPQEIRARFPDLAPIYENVMLRLESDLWNVVEDLKHHFIARTPSFWGPTLDGIKLILGTLIAIVLAQVGRIHSLRLLLAAALAVLLYMQASPALTLPLILVCVYVVGLGLSRIDPLDLWPWLGRCWKWPASFDPRDSQHAPLVPFGPLALAGTVSGAIAMTTTGQRAPLAVGFISGLALQVATNVVCIFRVKIRLRQSRDSLPAHLPEDDTSCDPDHLREAMRSCLILRKSNLMVFWSLLIVSAVSAVGAARSPWPLAFAWLAVFALGVLTPTVSAISWYAATRAAIRGFGLTTMFLRRTRGAYHGRGRGWTPYALGIDEPSLIAFTKEEKEELKRFVFLQRITSGQSLRRWFVPRDSVFVSYVWSDEENTRTAERLDETLRQIGTHSFRDTRAIQDPFAAWREHISLALLHCTHFFLVVSPGIKNGQVVLREIETVVQRWYTEMLPSVTCVVNPDNVRELHDDPQMPLQVRFLLTCCPQMTFLEAENPKRVRYIIEHTRRQGKWNDWLTLLSPMAARYRILRMPGIVGWER